MNTENLVKEVRKITGIESSLDSKANQIDLEVERKRIDSLTSLEQGSTTGDAELIDGRIDCYGEKHTNIGGHIRRSEKIINDNTFDIIDLPSTNWEVGALAGADGNLYDNPDRIRSIDIYNFKYVSKVEFTIKAHYQIYGFIYDENGFNGKTFFTWQGSESEDRIFSFVPTQGKTYKFMCQSSICTGIDVINGISIRIYKSKNLSIIDFNSTIKNNYLINYQQGIFNMPTNEFKKNVMNRVCTPLFTPTTKNISLKIEKNNVRVNVFTSTDGKTFAFKGWSSETQAILNVDLSNIVYFGFIVKKVDDGNLSPTDEILKTAVKIINKKEYGFSFKNLLEVSTLVNGYIENNIINYLDGRVSTGFISVTQGETYFKNQFNTGLPVCLYDINKTYISDSQFNSNGYFKIPVGVAYIRFYININLISLDEFVFCKVEKINKEFLEVNGIQKQNDNEYVPYNQVSKKNNPLNPLFIPTYDGGNQSMHPKMIYFPNKWNGYKYWLVTTPYKNWNDFIENPCIYCSNNGVHYDEPETGINPLDAITGSSSNHYNSDPHIVFNSSLNRLEVWWRYYKTKASGDEREIIYRMTSTDGINWTQKEELYNSKSEISALSPSIIYEDNKYKIWASHGIDDSRDNRVIRYWESVAGGDWVHVRDITLNSSSHNFSHLDVIHTKKGYEMVLQSVNKATSELDSLHYCISSDNNSYSTPIKILTRGVEGSWDDYRIYRPSLTKVDGAYYLYYGATSTKNNGMDWGTGLIITDDISNLIINS